MSNEGRLNATPCLKCKKNKTTKANSICQACEKAAKK